MINQIHEYNVLNMPWSLEDNSVDCCVTSPPYWGLRDYGVDGQLGLEKTPDEFIDNMVKVFDEVRRVLKPAGTLWVNIGDSYAATSKKRTIEQATINSTIQGGLAGQTTILKQQNKIVGDLKPKDLVGIPWLLAFALRSAGWYLRQDIIWSKPNPMPESVTDRCTKAHEYIFMLSKNKNYYYDAYAIRTPLSGETYTTFGIETKGNGDNSGLIKLENWANDVPMRKPKKWKTPDGWDTAKGPHGSFHCNGREKGGLYKDKQRGHSRKHAGFNDRWDSLTKDEQKSMGANKRSVWQVATQPFPDAHFATFPEDLIVPCIKAGCPEGGIVLDPFMGAGTTALVTRKLNRNFIGFELNPDYIRIAENRLKRELGMFL